MNRGFAGAPAETHSLTPVATNIPVLLERMPHRYPSYLVDAVIQHEPGARLVAAKNVTVGEEFFQGHFPGTPLMPGVLMIEALSQAAAVLLFEREGRPSDARAYLRGVDNAKFRRQVVPGDRLRLEVTLGAAAPPLAKAHGVALIGDQVVAEADLLLTLKAAGRDRSDGRSCTRPPRSARARSSGPTRSIGPHVRIGKHCRVGASAVIDGWTEIGDGTQDLSRSRPSA